MSDNRFDDLFAQIAGQSGGIDPLLNSFFGFLKRKTDFYVEFENRKSARKMGFPKGEAEKMLLKAFHRYDFQQLDAPEPKSTPAVAVSPKQGNIIAAETLTADAINLNATKPSKSTPLVLPGILQTPVGNGGYESNYYWTQTLNEVNIYIDIKSHIKSKNIICNIFPRTIHLEVENEVILSGSLEDTIKSQESMWTLSSTKSSETSQIIITLDKMKKTWWKCVLEGHACIDTTKVDSSQNISEYDEATQATIRQLMFDQKQKMLGLPLSAGSLLTQQLDNQSLLSSVPPPPPFSTADDCAAHGTN